MPISGMYVHKIGNYVMNHVVVFIRCVHLLLFVQYTIHLQENAHPISFPAAFKYDHP